MMKCQSSLPLKELGGLCLDEVPHKRRGSDIFLPVLVFVGRSLPTLAEGPVGPRVSWVGPAVGAGGLVCRHSWRRAMWVQHWGCYVCLWSGRVPVCGVLMLCGVGGGVSSLPLYVSAVSVLV